MTTHLLHVFPTFAVGGAQTVTARVLNGLGTGFRHTIVSLDGRTAAAELLRPDLAVELIDGRAAGRNLARRRRLLARYQPDLVLTCNWGSIDWLIAHRLGRIGPHIHQEHGFGPEEADRQLARRLWCRRVLFRWVDRLVVPSLTLAGLAREAWWVDPRRLVRIANGVETPPVSPPLTAEVRSGGTVRIGTLAPLRAEKRIDRLLRAFAALPAAPSSCLVIIGDGPERAGLERLAEALGVATRVDFLGHRRHPLPELAKLDIYALSSDTEQLPASVLEAMAVGLPVAAVAVGDVAAMVAAENRPFVVPRDDMEALVRALAQLVQDAPLRARLGAANRQRQLQEFNLEDMVAAYADLFAGLVRRGSVMP